MYKHNFLRSRIHGPMLCLMLCCGAGLFAAMPEQAVQRELYRISDEKNPEALAEELITKFWKAIERQHKKAYSFLLAPGFQGLNINGRYDREQQIEGLESLTIKHFKIKNIVARCLGNTLVASYDLHAKGHGVTSGPNQDTWHRRGKIWKLVAHAYVPFN
jgi:hypothetical protein